MKKINKDDLKKSQSENENIKGEEIELDDGLTGEKEYKEEFGEEDDYDDNSQGHLFHYAFLIVVLIIIISIIAMLMKWQKGKDLVITEDDITENYDIESMDYYSHFDPTEVEGYVDDGELRILIMGDESIGNYNDETGIPALIEKATGATVTVLALDNQTISTFYNGYSPDEYPEDAYSLGYALKAFCSGSDGDFNLMMAAWDYMDDNKIYWDYWDLAHSIQLEDYDVLILQAGANDYLEKLPLILDESTIERRFGDYYGTNVALMSGLTLLRATFPTLQVIVSSPSFMLTTDENGNTVGADKLNNGYATYGDYVSHMCGICEMKCVTFVDNYFMDEFNPDNYSECLEDNGKYPNAKGRQLIADHIVQNLYFIRNK